MKTLIRKGILNLLDLLAKDIKFINKNRIELTQNEIERRIGPHRYAKNSDWITGATSFRGSLTVNPNELMFQCKKCLATKVTDARVCATIICDNCKSVISPR